MSKDIGRIKLDIGVAYEESIDRLSEIFAREFPGMGARITGAVEDPVYDGIQRFDDSSVCLRFHLYIRTADRFDAERAFNREIYACFKRNGIEIPYNKITIA